MCATNTLTWEFVASLLVFGNLLAFTFGLSVVLYLSCPVAKSLETSCESHAETQIFVPHLLRVEDALLRGSVALALRLRGKPLVVLDSSIEVVWIAGMLEWVPILLLVVQGIWISLASSSG
jgi:hypothetical protein